MTSYARVPLGTLLRRPPSYGINAAAVPLRPGISTYLRITDIDSDGRFAPSPAMGVDHANVIAYRMNEGELVFARTGASVGKSYLYRPVDGELIYAGFLINIAPNQDRLEPRYLAFYTHTSEYWDWVARTSVRSGQPGVNGREYATLRVPLPDIATQKLIADVLDDADNLVGSLERLIAKKLAMKRGLLRELLTGRTRLPGFTSEWSELRLGDHVGYVKSVALSRAQLDASSPLRYLHYGDIHTSAATVLDAAREPMPRASAVLAGRAGLLRVGDLVFADASEDPEGVGKSIEIIDVPTDGVVPGLHTITARFDKQVLADGFKGYLQFIPGFRAQLLRLAAGTKVLSTTKSFISSVTLNLPGVDEQRSIAVVLRDADREIAALRARLAKARAIKQGMIQQLLTGRVRLSAEIAA